MPASLGDRATKLHKLNIDVHTLAPETYKLWSANIHGIILYPVDVSLDAMWKLFVIDRGDNETGSLIEVRLYYPPDEKILSKQLSSPVSRTYLDGGIVYVAQRGDD